MMTPRGRWAAVVSGAVAAGAAHAQCLQFNPTSGEAGVAGTVTSMTLHDPDGGGPMPARLVAAGAFDYAGSTRVDRCGLFDGIGWEMVGPGLTTSFTGPTSVCSHDFDGDGPLPARVVVGGSYSDARVKYWDGASWAGLGPGLPAGVGPSSLASFDADGDGPEPARLYAISGQLYRWEGTGWVQLGVFNFSATTLRVVDEDGPAPMPARLFVLGTFTTISGQPHARIAAFDGSAFHAVNPPTGTAVNDVIAFDPDGPGPLDTRLYLAGAFTDGAVTRPIVVREEAGWQFMGETGTGSGLAVADHDGAGPGLARLYRAGTTTGGDTVRVWTVSGWQSTGFISGAPKLTAFDPDGAGAGGDLLIAGGGFMAVGPTSPDTRKGSRGVAVYDGVSWRAPNRGGIGVQTFQSTEVIRWDHDSNVATPPQLLAVGDAFTLDGDECASMSVVGADGHWQGVVSGRGSSYNGRIIAFDRDGAGPLTGQLIFGGNFSTFLGVPARSVAFWSGFGIAQLGTGLPVGSGNSPAQVFDMVVYDRDGPGVVPPELVFAGVIGSASQLPFNGVVKWTGNSYAALGQGLDGTVTRLLVWDRDGAGPGQSLLVAGGFFLTSGSVSLPRAGLWNGFAWSPLPPGPPTNNQIYLLTVWDRDGAGPETPSLLVSTPGTSGGSAIWRLNGDTWSQMSTVQSFNRLFVIDEGGGRAPSLWLYGSNPSGSVTPDRQFARWNGQVWVWSDIGVRDEFQAVAVSGSGADTVIDVVGQIMYGPDSGSLASGVSSVTIAGLSPWGVPQQATLNVTRGADVQLGVEVTGGAPVFYQWRRNGVAVLNGPGGAADGGGFVAGASGVLSSAGPVVLTITGAGVADSGVYTCGLSSACGESESSGVMLGVSGCGTSDFNGDGDIGTDQDIEAFFACLGGNCCPGCFEGGADFNGDGDVGTDHDIEAFFRVLGGGNC
ncbi:MAG TPA: immunoglobulin domain-containing protein [Phycisphaerales bacterium]|nr:immunoglobulin domain-containing protein [Phycisphaerales bacterium]